MRYLHNILNQFKKLFSVDLRSLALTRIALSSLIIVDLLIRFKDLESHYTDSGVLPVEAFYELHWKKFYISLHALSGNYYFEFLLFIVAIFFAFLLLIGFKTRLSTIVSWFLLISLHMRNPLILTGGDTLLRCLMFWAIFIPWGQRFSVDSYLSSGFKKVSNTVFSWGILAFIIQIAYMYVSAAILKDSPEWRTDYTAVYYALSIGHYSYLLGPVIYKFPLLMKVMTFAVFWLELLGVLLFFIPYKNGLFRIAGLVLFISFQLGLFFTMRLGIFPWVCITSLFIFVPTLIWEKYPFFEIKLSGAFKKIHTSFFNMNSESMLLRFNLKKIHAFFLIIIFILIAMFSNMKSLKTIDTPKELYFDIRRTLRLTQHWKLFAPKPYTSDGWYVIEGLLENGEKIDLLRGDKNVNWDPPENRQKDYPTYRWRKYLTNLYLNKNKENRFYYAKYLCKEWNSNKENKQKLKSLDINYVLEITLPEYKTRVFEPRKLYSYSCKD